MRTSFLSSDENRPAELMLEDIAPTTMTPRETEAVAGCNCDRWGHPCPGCDERNVRVKAELPRAAHEKK